MSSSQYVSTIHKTLQTEILPRSNEVHAHYKQFITTQIKNLQDINHGNDGALDHIKKQWAHYNKIVNDFKIKDNRDKKFIQGSDLYLKAKEDQLTAKGKVLESFNAGIKETVSKIKPQKLSLLPLQTQPKLSIPFQTLYSILYNKPKSSFVWKQFKQKGLILNSGQDFITRLANINFKGLSIYQYDELRKLKNDEQFKEISQNSIHAVDIIDLADWVDYVVEGHKLALQKKQTELQYQKIRNDKSKRSDGSLKMRIQFCTQTVNEYDTYQNNLMSLEAELRTIIGNFKNDIESLNQIAVRRDNKIREINSL